MADIVGDGKTRVAFATSVANIASPTVAECNAAVLLHDLITADGYIGFKPDTNRVPTTPLSGKFNTNRVGRVAFPDGTMLRFKKQDGTDTIYDTLVYEVVGFIIERRSIAVATGWSAGQKVKVFPIQCGEAAWVDPEENTLERYEVPITFTSQPNLRATVAA